MVVGVREGTPVFLRRRGARRRRLRPAGALVWPGTGPAGRSGLPAPGEHPAVTIAVGKKPGENAVDVSGGLIARVE